MGYFRAELYRGDQGKLVRIFRSLYDGQAPQRGEGLVWWVPDVQLPQQTCWWAGEASRDPAVRNVPEPYTTIMPQTLNPFTLKPKLVVWGGGGRLLSALNIFQVYGGLGFRGIVRTGLVGILWFIIANIHSRNAEKSYH